MPCKAIAAWHGARIEHLPPLRPFSLQCAQASQDSTLAGAPGPPPGKESFFSPAPILGLKVSSSALGVSRHAIHDIELATTVAHKLCHVAIADNAASECQKYPTDSHLTPSPSSQNQGQAACWDTWETSFPPITGDRKAREGEQGRE